MYIYAIVPRIRINSRHRGKSQDFTDIYILFMLYLVLVNCAGHECKCKLFSISEHLSVRNYFEIHNSNCTGGVYPTIIQLVKG